MTNKILYSDSLLDKLAKRDNFKILQRHNKYTIKSRIDFECSCGKVYNKSFKQLYEAGGLCKECGIKRLSQTARERNLLKYQSTEYSKDVLIDIIKRDNCIIDIDTDTDISYYKNMSINFICSCGIPHQKIFKHLKKGGAYCKECTTKRAVEKCKDTCQQKYGCVSSLQVKEFRDKGKETWIATLGVDHPLKSKEVQERKKATCMETMGVSHQFLLPEIQEKCKNTIIEKYNVHTCMLVPEFKEKHKQTCLQNWGFEYAGQSPILKEKYKNTCLEKYNTISSMQVQEVKDKSVQTCLKKYNTRHPSQHPEIAEKQLNSAFKLKQYTFADGTIIDVQGYEPFLLDILVNEGYTSSDIITDRTEVPEIWYTFNNKQCRYYCDIYIPKTNTIYEVKSTWTYEKDIERNKLKQQACIDRGYNFKFCVFNYKGEIIDASEK